HVLAREVREVVTTVVAGAADHVGADDDPVPDAERYAFEVGVAPVAADGRHGADVLVPLDDREGDGARRLGAGVLRRVALVGVLVGPADPGELHAHQHAPRRRLRQRVLPYLVLAGRDQRGGADPGTSHGRCTPGA